MFFIVQNLENNNRLDIKEGKAELEQFTYCCDNCEIEPVHSSKPLSKCPNCGASHVLVAYENRTYMESIYDYLT